MTTEQRLELQQRIMSVNEKGKIPFKDCVRIARELNLSVQQVCVMCLRYSPFSLTDLKYYDYLIYLCISVFA